MKTHINNSFNPLLLIYSRNMVTGLLALTRLLSALIGSLKRVDQSLPVLSPVGTCWDLWIQGFTSAVVRDH